MVKSRYYATDRKPFASGRIPNVRQPPNTHRWRDHTRMATQFLRLATHCANRHEAVPQFDLLPGLRGLRIRLTSDTLNKCSLLQVHASTVHRGNTIVSYSEKAAFQGIGDVAHSYATYEMNRSPG